MFSPKLRFFRKSRKQRLAVVKAESSRGSDGSGSPDLGSSDDHPLIDLQPTRENEAPKIDNERNETSVDNDMPRKVNLNDLMDW